VWFVDVLDCIYPKEIKDTTDIFKKGLKIPKGQSESVYRRRTDNTMGDEIINRKIIKISKL
jgi:hypothetical protein